MLDKVIGFATGGPQRFLLTVGIAAVVGAAGATAGTLAVDNKWFHGPEIKRLDFKVSSRDVLIGSLKREVDAKQRTIDELNAKREQLGTHEAAAATTSAGACNAEVARALARGKRLGKAMCRIPAP